MQILGLARMDTSCEVRCELTCVSGCNSFRRDEQIGQAERVEVEVDALDANAGPIKHDDHHWTGGAWRSCTSAMKV